MDIMSFLLTDGGSYVWPLHLHVILQFCSSGQCSENVRLATASSVMEVDCHQFLKTDVQQSADCHSRFDYKMGGFDFTRQPL